MPFDNLNRAPVGDLAILIEVRERVSGEHQWLKRGYTDGNRNCLVAALSLACSSPGFLISNKVERRLARILVKHLPPAMPFWIRIGLLPARHRLMWFNDCRVSV